MNLFLAPINGLGAHPQKKQALQNRIEPM